MHQTKKAREKKAKGAPEVDVNSVKLPNNGHKLLTTERIPQPAFNPLMLPSQIVSHNASNARTYHSRLTVLDLLALTLSARSDQHLVKKFLSDQNPGQITSANRSQVYKAENHMKSFEKQQSH